eukprot:scaffold8232_cov31-Tisochrysis_lutea.AAC.3
MKAAAQVRRTWIMRLLQAKCKRSSHHVVIRSIIASPACGRASSIACVRQSTCGGLMTRWGVESHRSFVQRAIKSPRLITKASSSPTFTSIHSPFVPITCSPSGESPPSLKMVSDP